jgi:hypothetical protein
MNAQEKTVQPNPMRLTRVENGVSIMPVYRDLKHCAQKYADLKVNLARSGGELVVHVAGSEQEYQDLSLVRAHITRVIDTVAPTAEEIAEREAAEQIFTLGVES